VIAHHDVYQKTSKGSEAIATRQHGLSPKVRSLLILVDGKRNVDDLRKLSGVNGDAEQFLGELLESGCIARATTAAAPAARAPAAVAAAIPKPVATTAAAAASTAATLAEARRQAVRKLTDLLGPLADEACMRLEASRNTDEFLAALARAEDMLRQVRGAAAAAAFVAHMAAYRPVRA
jgi:hypothetical protein